MTPWWGEVVAYAILVAVLVGYLAIREHRFRRAQRRLTAASLDHALTVRRLETAKAEGRDVIDQHLAETPIYAETCEAEARRIAEAELDVDLRRLFDGSAS